ncbi:MAG TPA: TIGR03085 family metal-binding protein [Micromonosporaceae bacterium]|nr:TIGR03085 family metal-binding protein [Micromonosporaceae bacterium]
MVRYARRERESLADALGAVPPDAPTLCAGWSARDLAAHIVLRDRRPIAAAGILLKPLRGINERTQRRLAAGDYAELVATVRQAPKLSPMSVPKLDELGNTLEFFVHTEDVRRAQPDWQPRSLDAGLVDALWGRVGGVARLALRRVPAAITLVAPGRPPARGGAGGPAVEIRGDPGELLLFCSGRQQAARVEFDGPADVVARLRDARLGL